MSQKLLAQVARVSPEEVHKAREKMSAHLEKESLFSGSSHAQSLGEARLFSRVYLLTYTYLWVQAPGSRFMPAEGLPGGTGHTRFAVFLLCVSP